MQQKNRLRKIKDILKQRKKETEDVKLESTIELLRVNGRSKQKNEDRMMMQQHVKNDPLSCSVYPAVTGLKSVKNREPHDSHRSYKYAKVKDCTLQIVRLEVPEKHKEILKNQETHANWNVNKSIASPVVEKSTSYFDTSPKQSKYSSTYRIRKCPSKVVTMKRNVSEATEMR